MYKILQYLILLLLFIFSCTPRVAIKPGFDFTQVKSVGIGDFISYGNFNNSAELVKDEFTRQLIKMGYNVKRGKEGMDYIFEGTVTEFSPTKRYLFYFGDKDKQQQIIIGTLGLEISGSNVYSLGSAFGLKDSEILVSNATCGLTARLVDTKTGEIIWTNSFSYEALDIQYAVEGVVSYLLRSLVKPYPYHR